MGFIGKLFGKERKFEKILRASYRAGKRKGELEIGKDTGNVSSASSLVSSDDEAHHAKAAEGYSGAAGSDTYSRNLGHGEYEGQSAGFGAAAGPGSTVAHDKSSQTAYGATHGHQSTGSNSSGNKIGSSSKGQVVSQPPKVHRHPLGQTYGGDYADGKTPTELAVDSQKKDLENDHPRYDNEAAPVKGHGRFFDPKDTQGGLYKSGSDEDYHLPRDSQTPVGPAAAAASTALAGGVAKGEYGKDTEATHAQLHYKDLKTKPTAYAEEEAAKRHAAELETAAYNAGHAKGASNTSSVNDASSHKKSFDPRAEHLKNKSAFNEGGLAGATAEAKHEEGRNVSSKLTDQHAAVTSGHDSQDAREQKISGGELSGEKPQGTALAEKSAENSSGIKNLGNSSKDFSSKKSAEISGPEESSKQVGAKVGTGVGAGAASAAASAAAKNHDSGKSKTLDPAVGPSSSTDKPTENERKVPVLASGDSSSPAGLTSSGINSSSDAKTFAGAPNAADSSKAPIDYEQKIKRLDQSIAETQREIDALTKASASPSSFGKDTTGARTDSKLDKQGSEGADARYAGQKEKSFEAPVEPKNSTIGQASLPSGQPIHLNAATVSADKRKSPIGDDASFAPKGSENAGTVSESSKGSSSKKPTDTLKDIETGKPDSIGYSGSELSSNGYPASSASKSGARAGINGIKSESSNPIGLSSDKDTGLKNHENSGASGQKSHVSQSVSEGETKKTFGGNDVSKGSSDFNTDQSNSPKDGGYLDSAKAAIASAGVAAASSFGYEGYNKYYNTEDHTKDVLEAQEKEQRGTVESSIDSSNVSTSRKLGDGEKKPLPDSNGTHDGVKASNGTSGASHAPTESDSSKDAEEHKQEGLLEKLGLGTSKTVSSGVENAHTEKPSTGSGIGSSVAGAVAGVAGATAGAVGISKSSSGPHKVDSLVEEAASEFGDVRKEPRHKTEGGVLESSNKKESSLPDDLEPSKKEPSEAETSGIDNTKLEADIAAHNKKHGYTSGKSLVEVAEEKHPEIKKAPAHHESAEEESNDDMGARGLGSVPKEKSNHASESVKGKSHGESKEVEGATYKAGLETGNKAHIVSGAASGKTDDSAKEIEHATYVAGSKKAVTDSSKESRPKTSGLTSTSEPVVEAAVGKSRQESAEIESAAHLGGPGKSITHEKPVLDAAAGKSKEESKEIESAAVGDNFGDKQISGTSSSKEQIDSEKSDSGSGIGASIAGVVAGVAGGAAAAIGLTKTDDKKKEADGADKRSVNVLEEHDSAVGAAKADKKSEVSDVSKPVLAGLDSGSSNLSVSDIHNNKVDDSHKQVKKDLLTSKSTKPELDGGKEESISKTETSNHSKPNSGVGQSIAGAVAGVTGAAAGAAGAAAGAVGISKNSSEPHKVDSLVEEAASEFGDVRKEPRHKTEGGVLESSNKKESSLPDDLEPSKKEPSEAETSGIDNTKLEADIAAHNKKHGYTSGKSLVEVAEEKHPEIKKAPAHHESAEEESNDDMGARGLGSVPKEKSNHASESVKGKSHGESKEVDGATYKAGLETGNKAHIVSGAASGKTDDSAKEIEHAAYVAGSKKAVTDSSKESRPKTSGLTSTSEPVVEAAVGKSRQESAEIESAAHLGGPGKSISHEKPVLDAAAGKSKEESKEIESAAVGDNFGDKHTSSSKEQIDSEKSDSGSGIGASIAGVVAGVAGGAAAAIGLNKTDDKDKEAGEPVKKLYDDSNKTAETREKGHAATQKTISPDLSQSGSGINKPASAAGAGAIGLSQGDKEKNAINSSGAKFTSISDKSVATDEGKSHAQSDFDLPASKSNQVREETENAAYEAGATKAVADKVGAATGKSRQESIEIENAAQLRGTGGSVSHGVPVLDAAAGKTKEESREIESAATGVGSESHGAAGARNSKAGPVTDAATGKSRQESVEIENAAYLGGKEYSGSHSKPIEDAVAGKSKEESKEIEDAAFGANHKPNISGVTGSSSAALASRDVTSGKKDSGTADAPRPVIEVIGIPDRDEAQKLAQKTSRELLAKGEDLTGAKIVIDANKQEIYKKSLSKKDSSTVAAAGSVRDKSTGETARVTHPDASYNKSQHDIDGSRYHEAHEQVKEKLENEAQKGHLGNIPTERHTSKSGYDQSATQAGNDVSRTLGSGGATSSSGPSAPVGLGPKTGHTNVDASFFDAPKEIDGGANHSSHEKVKSTLEHEASKGKLGNVLPSSGGEGVLSDVGNAGPREYQPEGSSTEARKHSYSHKNEQKGKDVSYTEVTVSGEPDTKRAQALAQEAVFSLQGRKDILEVKELKVDAYTGSICDQDGRFIAQLSQRRLSQSDTGKRRKSSGGIVNLHFASSKATGAKSSPTASEGVVASEQASKSHGLDENAAAGLKQKTAQGPFSDKYNLATAQNTQKADETLKMPGSFF